MAQRHRLLLASLLAIAAASPAIANDSAAEKAAGGIELVENETVAMVSEDLRISVSDIDVAYVFRNEGREDEKLTVAFPLPPIDGYGVSMQSVDLPLPNEANFVGFTISVDGKTIEPELGERAFLGKTDVTETLKRYGLALNPLGDAFRDRVAAMTAEDYAALRGQGLLTERDMGEALWRYEATFHFDLTFPAGREVAIRHSYKPVRGLAFLNRDSLADPDFAKRYCVDAGTKRALEGVIRMAAAKALKDDPVGNAALKDDPLGGLGAMAGVPYILTTANNWSGPIGRFHLTIDKGKPENVVSLCEAGIEKTGPTIFEMTATDYVPKRDLLVLFGSTGYDGLGVPQ